MDRNANCGESQDSLGFEAESTMSIDSAVSN